ncbi:hypothetical protein FRB96_002751 [Tulasnella sp. 330]|nr:hypothetical protein FRB96_002751 [Tulasnella sp. 330]
MPEPPPFTGGTLADCQKFIMSIRKHAYAHGWPRDNARIADYAACCLDGEAQLWHLQLPAETTEDWVKIQRALVDHYSLNPRSAVAGVASPLFQTKRTSSSFNIRDDALVGIITVQSGSLNGPLYIGAGDASDIALVARKHAIKLRYIPPYDCVPGKMQVLTSNIYHSLIGLVRFVDEESEEVWTDE